MQLRDHWLFRVPGLSRGSALARTERWTAVTSAVSALELLCGGSQGAKGELNDHEIIRSASRKPLRPFVSKRSARALQVGRVAAATALLLPSRPAVRACANVYLCASCVLTMHVERHGKDGSDQATMLVTAVTSTARLIPTPFVVDSAMWFVTLQSALSYVGSGLAKVISETWTSGDAVDGVFRTQVFGHERVWRVIHDRPATAKALARSVIGLELGLPLLLLGRHHLARIYITVSGCFHVANAVVMGLERFVPAFAAMHPAVLYVSSRDPKRSTGEPPRSDAFPVIAAATVGAGLAALEILASWDRHAVRRTQPGDSCLAVSSGNTLVYRVDGRTHDGPLLLLEAGLGESQETWTTVAAELSRTHRVLRYSRAGYGASTIGSARSDSGHALEERRSDLRDLLDAVAGDGDVVLVGHGFGAHLCLTACPPVHARTSAIVAIDPTYVNRGTSDSFVSDEQRGRVQRIAERSVHAGLGGLLTGGVPSGDLSRRTVRRLRIQNRSPYAWTAMRIEIAGESDERDPDAAPTRLTGRPVLVMVSNQASTRSPDRDALDRELAACHPNGRVRQFNGEHGSSNIRRLDVATQISNEVHDFLEGLAR